MAVHPGRSGQERRSQLARVGSERPSATQTSNLNWKCRTELQLNCASRWPQLGGGSVATVADGCLPRIDIAEWFLLLHTSEPSFAVYSARASA